MTLQESGSGCSWYGEAWPAPFPIASWPDFTSKYLRVLRAMSLWDPLSLARRPTAGKNFYNWTFCRECTAVEALLCTARCAAQHSTAQHSTAQHGSRLQRVTLRPLAVPSALSEALIWLPRHTQFLIRLWKDGRSRDWHHLSAMFLVPQPAASCKHVPTPLPSTPSIAPKESPGDGHLCRSEIGLGR